MRHHHDRFAKKLVQATLEPSGVYTSEMEVSPDGTPDDEEFLMQTQNIVEQMRGEARIEGQRQMLLAVYRARFGAIPRKVRAAVERAQDDTTLTRYGEMFATCSADEIASALVAKKL